MKKYYKLDSRKVSYREYWNILRSWKVIIPWTAKLLNIPMNFLSGMPYFESVRELEMAEEALTPRAREKLEPMLEQCRQLGFDSPQYSSFETMHRETASSVVTMMHPSGAVARVMYTVSHKGPRPTEKTQCFILSELRDGTFLVTSSQRQQFFSAPGIVVNRLIGAGPGELIQFHLQKLAELPLSNPPKRTGSTDGIFDVCDRYEKRSRDFGFQRGIYVLMNPEETASEHQHVAEAQTMAAGNEKDVAVLIELNKLQNKKASWTGMIILFVISLVLFVGAGKGRWPMDYLFILMGVLFVHELGHYLAMRVFKYRNVQMFFIPFLGAAVTGRHYNVPGWKKAVVSLMGPVPGIFLALLVGGLGWYLHEPILIRIAVVSLILNGSNLIPVLPLDGGWVFHSLLFSRHYMLDVVFRALAAAALITVSVLLNLKSLMYVGILTAITLPLTYRMVKIAAALKQRGLTPLSEDNQTIPPATAQAIIAEVRQVTTKPQSNRSIAQQTLRIFEMLNARPPGWSATIGLLFVQCASVAVAIVFAVAFLLIQNPLLMASGLSGRPKHKLIVEQFQTWQGDPDNDSSRGRSDTLVATLRTRSDAVAAFQEITNRLPSSVTLKLFGDSLLLSLPPNDDGFRKQWLSELSQRSKDAFVDKTNFHATFSITCFAPDPDAAKEIVTELHDYFGSLITEAILPPWQPGDFRTPEERRHNEMARKTWLNLQDFELGLEDDTNFDDLENQIETAQENGESNVGPLQMQIAALKQKLYQQELPAWLDERDGVVDTNIADLFVALNTGEAVTNQDINGTIRAELAQRMGGIPSKVTGADRFCAESGTAECSGQTVNVSFVSFNRADDGPVALATWLRDKGCNDFKYSFLPVLITTSDSR